MSEFVVREVLVVNERGLHARPATQIVQTAARYKADVELERDGQRANGKSVMGMLLLGCARGSTVTVRARGDDAEAAVTAIADLFARRFGEST